MNDAKPHSVPLGLIVKNALKIRSACSEGRSTADLGQRDRDWFAAVFSGGPTSLAQVRPGVAILVALGIEHLRTRIFRGIELQDHPLGIRNTGVRCRV